MTNTEVIEFQGKGKLRTVVARDRASGEQIEINADAAFVFIGLTPNTGFLAGTLELDQWGFIKTDASFQSSMPGVFASGDVRAGSTKQLASATGEGATALIMVRQYLEKLGEVMVKR
ncbi:MAG TPA: NAD(P)/FAD-dependent oxidoreductase [Fimbriimonas sp.]|nr:NAD(P)/FAD-dependent oxidoreductase [Fimbriimonas sp.]